MSVVLERVREEGPSPTEETPGDGVAAVTVIERRPGWRALDPGEVWRCRELLFFLAWRDVKVRYKQTVLGAAWAVLQPLATVAVFSLVFGRVAAAETDGVPYPLFVLAGLLPWLFFAGAVTAAGQSVVGNQALITKVYFPRIIIPIAAVGAGLVDFAVASVLLLGMMAVHGIAPGSGVVLVPLVMVGLIGAALGVGALLAALTVAYRDFRHAVPFLIQLWMFATPSIYMQAERAIGPRWRLLLPLNPAHGLIDNFRRALLGEAPDWYTLLVSGAVGLALLPLGGLYFRRVERDFSDII